MKICDWILRDGRGLGLLLLVVRSSASNACGIEWSVPVTHFDGVDSKGHVCYSEKIGEVDVSDGVKLPLIINFRSDREFASPYLGKGWILALLDSNFVQTAENAFLMTQPDGWVRPFYRAKASDNVLDGGVDWKAEIKGENITAWAGCGWKLTYIKGRLNAISTPKNRRLEFVYSANGVTELREGGEVRLTVERDPSNGRVRAISSNKTRVEISYGKRPRLQVIGGQTVVAGMDESLAAVSHDDKGEDFEFGITDKMQPNLRIAKKGVPDRLFVWDAVSRRIRFDSGWNYQVEPQANLVDVAITRMDQSGKKEYWLNESGKGRETVQTIDGIVHITDTFVSGPLRGRIRKKTESSQSGEKIVYRATYDDKGDLIRKLEDGIVAEYNNGSVSRLLKDGEVILSLQP